MSAPIKNPNGTIRKEVKNKTFVLDPKAFVIRTYSRSNISNEVTLSKTEQFQNLATAELRFNLKK